MTTKPAQTKLPHIPTHTHIDAQTERETGRAQREGTRAVVCSASRSIAFALHAPKTRGHTHTNRQREEEGEKERERRVWIAYIAFQTPSLLVSNDKRQHTTLTSLSRRRSRSAALRQTDDLRKKRRTGENFMNELAHQTKGSAQETGTEGGREGEGAYS